MLSKISEHLSNTQISPRADMFVLAIGVLMLTTAIVGTLVTPAMEIQAQSDLETAREAAAL